MTTKQFDKRLAGLTSDWQRRIMTKLLDLAEDPYAPNNNVKKLQGRNGYRLRIGDWRVIYELMDEELVLIAIEMDTRGGIY